MNRPNAAPAQVDIIVVFRPNASPICVDIKPPKMFIVAKTMIEASTLNIESEISKINDA